jgi:protocatechuate 3,4-dioxygenase alpha subunit
MTLPRTASQTVGPFYEIGMCRRPDNELAGRDDPGAVELVGRLIDGAEQPIMDGLIEVSDPAGGKWGRCGTDAQGSFSFVLEKPAALPGQAPRLDVFVFARGLLRHQLTRIYFGDEAEANAADPVLSSLEEADRDTLVAEQGDGVFRFDIQLQGERATLFFEH